eukprot:UN02995
MYFEKPILDTGRTKDRRAWYKLGQKREAIKKALQQKRKESGKPDIDIDRILDMCGITVEQQRGALYTQYDSFSTLPTQPTSKIVQISSEPPPEQPVSQ